MVSSLKFVEFTSNSSNTAKLWERRVDITVEGEVVRRPLPGSSLVSRWKRWKENKKTLVLNLVPFRKGYNFQTKIFIKLISIEKSIKNFEYEISFKYVFLVLRNRDILSRLKYFLLQTVSKLSESNLVKFECQLRIIIFKSD